MGILRAAATAASGVLKEQWREAFFCDALDSETLLVRGKKCVGERSANTDPNDSVITNGSILSVADGQCVLVVSQGKVIDFSDEPGEHLFEDPNHRGGLGGMFKDVWNRIGFGGDVQPLVHRVYYVNIKECTGIRFDTPAPIPLRVRDAALGADLDLSVEAGGVYSYRVKDPAVLYKRIVGNIERPFQRQELNKTVTTLLLSHLPEALHAFTEDGIRPYELAFHTKALGDAVIAKSAETLLNHYGLEFMSIAFDTLIVSDLSSLQSAQHAAVNRDPTMAAATLTQGAADALKE